ncbi:hypothetical protein LUZ60_007796 [Juncus effusus]|nr:hypothetical protein LUZ60_007796 [Juncus effusus]
MATLSLQHSRFPLCYPRKNPNRRSSSSFRLTLAIIPRRKLLRLTASAASSKVEPVEALERCFEVSSDSSAVPSCSLCAPSGSSMGKKGRGGALSPTLQRSKVDSSQMKKRKPPEVATGGGGGDIGKKNRHGGGDGGDDDGDDDDYFGDFDEEEGDDRGLFRRRVVFQEQLFDRKFVDAVLQEWCKTMVNLPAGLCQAYEMGLVSSAQMVKYFTVNARPTTSRFISRALPESLSRVFIGRILADPAFLYKLLLESVATLATTSYFEYNNRKDRIKEEWDLALTNILTVTACNALVVWSLAPCRSYGSTFTTDLQNSIQKLPNNIFEKNYPMREFDLSKRVQSFVYRTAQLGLAGALAGTVQGGLSHFLANKKESGVSVAIPSVSSHAIRYGAFMGLFANLRYQALCGLDRAMFDQFDVLGVYLFLSTALRTMNTYIGEKSRQAWIGLESDPLMQSATLLRAYKKPSEIMEGSDSRWFISKNAIVSGLGLLGLKGSDDAESAAEPPKPRRKRTVRKKVSASSV